MVSIGFLKNIFVSIVFFPDSREEVKRQQPTTVTLNYLALVASLVWIIIIVIIMNILLIITIMIMIIICQLNIENANL